MVLGLPFGQWGHPLRVAQWSSELPTMAQLDLSYCNLLKKKKKKVLLSCDWLNFQCATLFQSDPHYLKEERVHYTKGQK